MDIVNRMDSLAKEWENLNDNRAIFLRCYCMMTQNMVVALDAKRFQDEEWVRHMLGRFAEYYFDALACFDCGEEVPNAWKYVHEAAEQEDLHVLQHLFLGVNAHINYDLVLTLYEILRPEWYMLPDSKRENRYKDHLLVNTIIAETIDKVQDEVVEKHAPGMDIIDKLMGRLDEKLIAGMISNWRKSVWKHTLQLLESKGGESVQAQILEIEEDVMKKARWIVRL
ncbi:MAG: DUF5995 family protein [Bacteroidia bacterium]|nr:DUF5995 family protein [Bacteroidia bacterium]